MLDVFLLIFGLGGLALGLRGVLARRSQSKLPRVQGHLIERDVREDTSVKGEKVARFIPRPVYSFYVDGVEHKGEQLTPSPVLMSEVGALTILSDLPDEPKVYYDPEDPSLSFLAPDPALFSWMSLAVGLGSTFLGAGGLLAG